ncbi:MAG TPA: hypothetical protein VFI74_03535 [Candidatus Saccharimonadales bacterium]|nr:hypothetical protein [Candidatus Saccharimonadales bacterium]
MTTLEAVPLLPTPDEFRSLHSGEVTLHNVPFFENQQSGSALQVGLEPDECSAAARCDLHVNISDEGGQHALEVSRTDHQPFTVEWTDESEIRQPALSRPVESLKLTETDGPWLSVEVPGDEAFFILQRPGINYLAQVLTMFALRAQDQEAQSQKTVTATNGSV